MPVLPAEILRSFAARVFAAHGAPPAAADLVAAALVQASLLGHDSHGILRVGRYVEKIRQGQLRPDAQPAVAHREGATAVVDGGLGFGHVSASFGTDLVIELARAHGVGAVSLSRTTHIGRLGEWAERIAAAGQIGLVFASGAGPGGSVAAHGGGERIFGTNPLAWAVPVPTGRGPLVADFATSTIPEGKVAMARARGEQLPAGLLLDRDGRPTTDPAAYYAGGALLPFGGHKGYSLVLLIEIMASLLARSVPASSAHYQAGNPTLLISLSVEAFLPRAEFDRHVAALLARVESSRPAAGGERVWLPHGLELATAGQRRREGIPIPDALWQELEQLGLSCGIGFPPTRP